MSDTHTASGSGRHKVILLGEHAVVHGTRALGAPLDGEVVVEVVRGTVSSLQLSGAGGEQVPEALARMARQAGVQSEGLEVRVKTGLEAGAGLGGSAALCVAFARAILSLTDRGQEKEAVVELAQEGERVFHGNPSGIDAWLAASTSPALFSRREVPRDVEVAENLHLAILVDEARADTSSMVQNVARLHESDRERVGAIFADIEALVIEAAEAIRTGARRELGRLMTANHALLGSLGVTTDGLDHLRDRALEAGALGAKMTGGGGGGAVIALAQDGAGAERVVRKASGAARLAFTAVVATTGGA
ncbi:MAG: mevalonate kinase [Deltaproteobacteria bacterium]|nr:mevalonate kinase [Deltaproteobacteria bacterium]